MEIGELASVAKSLSSQVWVRFLELLQAPMNNPEILWSAIPLLIATLFITLYFGRYKKEELGWNTAFGNTMVFMFVALNLIKKMYTENGSGSFENILGNSFYFTVTAALIATSIFLMFVTYFHILPKRFAFFLFSAPPINVSVYVVMAIVYAGVPADWITLLATLVFLALILAAGKVLQFFEGMIGLGQGSDEDEKDFKIKKTEKEQKGIPKPPRMQFEEKKDSANL